MKFQQLLDRGWLALTEMLLVQPAEHVQQVDDRRVTDDVERMIETESRLPVDLATYVERRGVWH